METLYNGIILPDEWPPENICGETGEPMPVPYLENPPDIIPVNTGRQLFVDDFLIDTCESKRVYHKPEKLLTNPVLSPQTALELNGKKNPSAMPVSGGVWWDPADKIFKMWYQTGWMNTLGYAFSSDGIRWERPDLDIEPGTNRILEKKYQPDSSTVFIDYDTKDPEQRYKLFIRPPNRSGPYNLSFPEEKKRRGGIIFTSSDGIHWRNRGNTGSMSDRSTIFYNPFRKKWVYSLKSNLLGDNERTRSYREHSDFVKGRIWEKNDPVFWACADRLDQPDPYVRQAPQLYNLDAVGYESIMLGFYQIHKGPKNIECMEYGVPKITELVAAYSRDGFHWHRPDRTPFIAAERGVSSWDRGHVQSVGGVCLVVKDKLYFYYSGIKGDLTRLEKHITRNGMYAEGATGLAMLRRDGFVSLSASDKKLHIVTRKITFDSGRYLFVNVKNQEGILRVELMDENGKKIEPFTLENCVPVSTDSTKKQIRWKGSDDFSKLAGRALKIKFQIAKGDLFSFWISNSRKGTSRGYLGAGSPGSSGFIDK